MEAEEHQAKVVGKDLPISIKHVIEICNYIRGRSIDDARKELHKVVKLERAIPFKIYKDNTGHRKSHMGAGRYPVKASSFILKMLDSLEANAQNKGLDINSLYLTKIIPNKAHEPWHYGRLKRRQARRSHVEIIGEELEKKQEKKKSKEQSKK